MSSPVPAAATPRPADDVHVGVDLGGTKIAAALVATDGTLQIGKHTSELQSLYDLVCRLLLEKKKPKN